MGSAKKLSSADYRNIVVLRRGNFGWEGEKKERKMVRGGSGFVTFLKGKTFC